MTSTDKTTLKTYFNTGDIPTEAQFHALIDSVRRSFSPLDFGAVADGTTDDTTAIQAAITAAADSGGIVDGEGKTYRIDTTDFATDLGGFVDPVSGNPIYYRGNYGLLMRSISNVTIRNMTLVLPELPELGGNASYIAIAVDKCQNVKIDNVTFDATAVSAIAMSTQDEGGAIVATYTTDFDFGNCKILNGWGRNGAITTIGACEKGWVHNNRFATTYNHAIWLDGFKYGWVEHNYMDTLCTQGIHLAANTDISRISERVQVSDNICLNKGSSVILGGATACSVVNNLVAPIFGADPFILQGASLGATTWDCYENVFLNNYMVRQLPASGNFGIVFKLQGVDDSGRVVRNNYFHNNVIRGNWDYAFYMYENCQDNEFTYNKISLTNSPSGTTGDDGSASITGNTVTPNY